jgi:uncharacterized protein YraI
MVHLACALLLSACGRSGASAQDPVQIRDPHPTFTPTPRQAVDAPAAAESAPTFTPAPVDAETASVAEEQSSPQSAPQSEAPAQSQPARGGPTPKLVVNTALVNLREGPGTDFNIVTIVDLGYEMEITGKNSAGDWWRVCCVGEQAGWIAAELVDTNGPVDQVPVTEGGAPLEVAKSVASTPTTAPPTQPPAVAPAVAPVPEATATPEPASEGEVAAANSLPFDLVTQEQFPETSVMRIFLYVYDDTNALEGYTLRVVKDGNELPVSEQSFGPNPGFSWPVANPRQRFQNMKIEFPGVAPAGTWEVQLIQNGTPAGPPATFILIANDPNQELYVRYERR